MKKVITVEGMHCAHCSAHVEQVLNALDGVKAKVDLKKKAATVELSADVSDEILMGAVKDAGYEPVSVQEKKGLFSR